MKGHETWEAEVLEAPHALLIIQSGIDDPNSVSPAGLKASGCQLNLRVPSGLRDCLTLLGENYWKDQFATIRRRRLPLPRNLSQKLVNLVPLRSICIRQLRHRQPAGIWDGLISCIEDCIDKSGRLRPVRSALKVCVANTVVIFKLPDILLVGGICVVVWIVDFGPVQSVHVSIYPQLAVWPRMLTCLL